MNRELLLISHICLVSNELTYPRRALDVNKANQLALAWLAKIASENVTVSITPPRAALCLRRRREMQGINWNLTILIRFTIILGKQRSKHS